MSRTAPAVRKGFSLIELVIVVVIIGIIAAIAIPRMSRGAAGAADSALSGNLNVLRNSIELYATEHGGVFPGNHLTVTTEQALTKFTDDQGAASDTKTATHIYGPYLRKVPPVTVGPMKNKAGADDISTGIVDVVEVTPTAGWLYNKNTGHIKANTAEADQNGKSYAEY
jgi:prepilin-type N-terminal cleavage/methylation domain-containing protein